MKNTKFQISKICENVKSNNRIIQKMINIMKINAAFENPKKIAGNIAGYPSNNLLN